MAEQSVVLLACGSFNPPTIVHLRMFELARDYLQRNGSYNVIAGIISPVSDAYNKKGAKWCVCGVNSYSKCGMMYPGLFTWMIDLQEVSNTNDLASSNHRCEMVKLALSSSKWIRLDTWESDQPQWLETEKVLSHHRVALNNQANDVVKCSPSKKRKTHKKNESNWRPVSVHSNKEEHEDVQLMLLCGGDVLESFSVPGLWTEEDIEAIVKNYGIVCKTRNGSEPRKFIYESDILTKHQDNIHIVTDWIQNEISSTQIRRALGRNESVKYLLQDSVIEYIHKHGLYGVSSDK